MRIKRPYHLLSVLALCTLLTSCISAGYVEPTPVGDVPRPEYPGDFKASHRVLLQANDREYDFIGYMTKGDGKIRAVAFGEMGGRFFDLSLSSDGAEVLLKPDGMGERPLREGVLEDIRYLYGEGAAGTDAGKGDRMVEFSDYRLFEGWDKPLPSVTVVKNRRWGYVMRLELLTFEGR